MKRAITTDKRLRRLLARHDDRLLADIGLSRDEVLGAVRSFWSGWEKRQAAWRL